MLVISEVIRFNWSVLLFCCDLRKPNLTLNGEKPRGICAYMAKLADRVYHLANLTKVALHRVPAFVPTTIPVPVHPAGEGLLTAIIQRVIILPLILPSFLQTRAAGAVLTGIGVSVAPEKGPEKLLPSEPIYCGRRGRGRGRQPVFFLSQVHLYLHLWVVHHLNGHLHGQRKGFWLI